VLCLQALPDGRIISGAEENKIIIWDGTPIPHSKAAGGAS
jgi:hypothetical protein